MRLLLVADLHDAAKTAEKIPGNFDAVIAAGDFTYRRSLMGAVEALEGLARIDPVYFGPGNTDPPELARYENAAVKPVHGRVLPLGPYAVGGPAVASPHPSTTSSA